MTPDTLREWIDLRTRSVRQHMPPAFSDCTVEVEQLASWCGQVIAGQAGSVLLLGNVGTGKSGSAWATWPHLIALGWTGVWRATTEQAYLDALLPGGDRQIALQVEACDVLLLDDVGSASLTDWSRGRLFALLDARWTFGRPTLVTSNLTSRQIEKHLGERAVSRLGQHLTTITLTGPDRRAQ
jgi:DNA replication protein DnaC